MLPDRPQGEVTSPDSSAKAELGLLLQLVGHDTDSETGSEFCLNLFEGEEPGESSTTDEANFDGGLLVTIDAAKATSNELDQVLENLSVEQENTSAESDLLELMDSAN